MKSKEEIPEGYEVQLDMFGIPYLQRKPSTVAQKWAERLFVPYLVALGIVIYLIVR